MKDINLNNDKLFGNILKYKNKIYDKLKDYEISVDNIFNRFKYISNYVKEKKLPPKDYKYIYSKEEVNERYKLGEISKSRYEKITKNNVIERDFQCTYCNYLKKCIEDDNMFKFKPEETNE